MVVDLGHLTDERRHDALRELVKAELPAWCAPRALELATSLPRTALGKVRRRQL